MTSCFVGAGDKGVLMYKFAPEVIVDVERIGLVKIPRRWEARTDENLSYDDTQ